MPRRMLTVLQVLPALDGGGVERGVVEVSGALIRSGHRSLVVSAGGRLVSELTAQGAQHLTCPIGVKSPLTLRWVPWLRHVIVREQVDVIDIHSRLPGWIAWLAWKSLPTASRPHLISTVHGLHSVSRYSSVMCRGETVIVVSETLLNYVLSNYPRVDVGRLRLIHRGVDSAEYPRGFYPTAEWLQDFHTQYPETADRRLITLPGRLTRLKGHIDFLEMMASLRRRSSAIHGLIVGGAHPRKAGYADELRERIRQMGLQHHITMTGHRSDLKEIYAISDIVLSLSQTPESFGRTVAEALAIGTKVVGYNHGGVAEILAAQFPQGAVAPGDVEALRERVLCLLKDRDRSAPGPNRFEKSDMLRRTLDVYSEFSEPIAVRKAA